jgi:predicted phosphodiesterase
MASRPNRPAVGNASRNTVHTPNFSPLRFGVITSGARYRLAMRIARIVIVLGISLIAGNTAAKYLGTTEGRVGPATVQVSHNILGSSVRGGSEVVGDLEPAGKVEFNDLFTSPLQTEVRVRGIDQNEALQLRTTLADSDAAAALEDEVVGQARRLLIRSALEALAWFVVGAAVGAIATVGVLDLLTSDVISIRSKQRDLRIVSLTAAVSLVLGITTFGTAALTLRTDGLAQPKLTGYLSDASTLLKATQTSLQNYQQQSSRLTAWLDQLAQTQQAFDQLASQDDDGYLRFLVIADVHSRPCTYDRVRTIARVFGVGFVINAGDETEWGSEYESQVIPGDACSAKSRPDYLTTTAGAPIPVYQVKGNHDSASTMSDLGQETNVTVLDEQTANISVVTSGVSVSLSLFGFGDPRFTPDDAIEGKETGSATSVLGSSASRIGREIGATDPDIVVTHDPVAMKEVATASPVAFDGAHLLIAGHTHLEDTSQTIDGIPLLVNGTTGGGGLRTVQGGTSGQASVMTVVYLDPATKKIARYGIVTVNNDGSFSYAIKNLKASTTP